MPPSRYKVVERGRRLIVVDRLNGMPVGGIASEQREKLDRLQQRLRVDTPVTRAAPSATPTGMHNVITTQRWFDDKAPRRVRIDEKRQSASALTLAGLLVVALFAIVWLGWLVLLVVAFLLLQSGVRRALRKAITTWLDGMEQVRS